MRAGLLFFGNPRDRLTLALGNNRFRRRLIPNAVDTVVLVAVLLEVGTLICAFVFALRDFEFRSNPPIAARLETPDLQLARVNQRKGWRLHAADRGDVAPARTEHAFRNGARAVDANEPVALAARPRGIGQTGHFRTVPQILKTVANRLRRHRLQPETFDRMLIFREPAKIGENQLAFAPRVASVDELLEIFASDELFQDVEAIR